MTGPAETGTPGGLEVLRGAAAVLLDMDGTLILSEPVHRATWDAFAHYWGITLDDRQYEDHFMGRRAQDVVAHVPGPWTDRDVTESIAAMSDHALGNVHTVIPVPGAADLIRLLHDAGVTVAVVTSAGISWATEVLGAVLGIREMVTTVVTAEDVVHGKPSPEGYLTATGRLGVRPEQCAAVEDSPSGLRALAAAGVASTIGITTTSPAGPLLAAGARWTVPNLHPDTLDSALNA